MQCTQDDLDRANARKAALESQLAVANDHELPFRQGLLAEYVSLLSVIAYIQANL